MPDMRDDESKRSQGGATPARQVSADEQAVRERRAAARKGPQRGPSARTGALMVFALAVGGAAGWFARHAQAQPARTATAEGEEGACATWEKRICSEAGQEALACYEARAAANLLPATACEAALESVPDTLARVAAGREVCQRIVTRLCADLGEQTQTCAVVREKTELFPPERCQEMLDNYDQVIGELRLFQQQMAPGIAPPPGAEAPQPSEQPAPQPEQPAQPEPR